MNGIIKGITLEAKNGRYDQLLVKMAVGEIEINGEKHFFPKPRVVTLSLEPYRMVIPLKEKSALVAHWSEVEFRISDADGSLKVELAKVKELTSVPMLEEFIASL